MPSIDETGMALVGVIMVVMIFLSLGTVLLVMAEQEYLTAHDERDALQALYTAESGARLVAADFENKLGTAFITMPLVKEICSAREGFPVGMDSLVHKIVPRDMGREVELSVTGLCGEAKKELVVNVEKPRPVVLDPALLRGLTEADFCLDMEFFKYMAENIEGEAFYDSIVFSDDDLKEVHGVYYVEGSVSVHDLDHYSGEVVIAAEGDITVSGDVLPEDSSSSLALVSGGDINLMPEKVGARSRIQGVIIAVGGLKPTGAAGEPGREEGTGGGGISGLVLAGNIRVNREECMVQPTILEGLEEYLGIIEVKAEIKSWREKYDIY